MGNLVLIQFVCENGLAVTLANLDGGINQGLWGRLGCTQKSQVSPCLHIRIVRERAVGTRQGKCPDQPAEIVVSQAAIARVTGKDR